MLPRFCLKLMGMACLLAVEIGGVVPATAEVTGGTAERRLWLEARGYDTTPQASLRVRIENEYALPASLVWDCTVDATEPFDDVVVALTVRSPGGNAVDEGSVVFNIKQGENPCRLTWNPEGLPDGTYTVELSAVRMGDDVLAGQTFEVRLISRDALQALLSALEEDVSILDKHLAAAKGKGPIPPYAAMRLAIVQDYLPPARRAFEAGDWRRSMDDVRFLRGLLKDTRVGLSLAIGSDRIDSSLPARIDHVSVANGSFLVGGRPVFLLGAAGDSTVLADALPALRRYGLNLAVTKQSPAETLSGKESADPFPPMLETLLTAAKAEGMGVTVRLAPDAMCGWAYDAWPTLADHRSGTFQYDITRPEARKLLERHMHTVLPGLAGQGPVVSVALADRPEMQFEGESVRQGLIAMAKSAYGDHETMNRVWETLYLNFDEVQVVWDYTRPAYRYDLEVYQQELGTEFLSSLAARARKDAPGVPLQIDFADRAFAPGESAFGVDREKLERLLDVSGCEASQDLGHSYLALGYPNQSLNYALLRSLNPNAPVFNIDARFTPAPGTPRPALREAAYALTWEGAMSGLCALSVPLGSPDDAADSTTLLGSPERLEGYATACLDLNRLAPVVTAFQQAPAGISIVWSKSSKIYNDGDPYLESVRHAYEGCHTFGYTVNFVTEEDCAGGALDSVRILVIPEAPSLSNEAFEAIDRYLARGGVTIHLGKPIPYTPRGVSRQDGLTPSTRSVLIRGTDSSTSYLHALDAACALEGVEPIPRAVNAFGYPLEGVKTRFTMIEGVPHLYAINLRKASETVYLTGPYTAGQDLIAGRAVQFPANLEPLAPVLVRLDGPAPGPESTVAQSEAAAHVPAPEGGVPSGIVEPVRPEEPAKPAPHPRKRHAGR